MRVGEEVPQRSQTGRRPLEHGDPCVTEDPDLVVGDRRREVRDHAERLRRGREHVPRHLEVPDVVRLTLPGEIHDEGDRRCLGIVVQRLEALDVDPVRVDAGPPRVERVLGDEPRIEHLVDPVARRLRDLRERDAEVRREVDEERPLPARVVQRCDPGPARHAARAREQLEGVGHLLEVAALVDAEGIEHRLVGAVLPRERARVGHHHLLRSLGPADLQREHRDVALGGLRERRHEPLGPADRLEQQRHDLRRLAVQGVGQVLVHRRDDLLPARDQEVEPDLPVVEQERRPPGAGVRQERHRTRTEVVRREEPRGPQVRVCVHEAHPVATAERHPVLSGDRRHPVCERRHPGLRRLVLEQRGERHDAARARLARHPAPPARAAGSRRRRSRGRPVRARSASDG